MTPPLLLTASEAMALLGFRSRTTLAQFRRNHPDCAIVPPGMRQPRYLRVVLADHAQRARAGKSVLDPQHHEHTGRDALRAPARTPIR